MKQCILVCMTVAVVFGISAASVRADDIYPPPWTRGLADTTFQDWTFTTDVNPSPADEALANPYGTPQATISGAGNVWHQFYDNHNGVWTLASGASMDLYIPNTPRDNTRYKDVHTQVTWEPNLSEEAPVVMVNGIASEPVFTVQVGDTGWFQSVYDTRLDANPDSEDVVITGSYSLGEVVIDTQCVPEPSSLALLAMGAFGLAGFVWRRKR
jgi:hypothetical protein